MAVNRKEFRHPYYTLQEYFALEGAGHARYEYWEVLLPSIDCVLALSEVYQGVEFG
jgi:hypothetical protein